MAWPAFTKVDSNLENVFMVKIKQCAKLTSGCF